jgi:hypothetical protein
MKHPLIFAGIYASVPHPERFASVMYKAPIAPCRRHTGLRYRGSVQSEVELARQNLELAKETSDRLWEEHSAFSKNQPPRAVMGAEERQLLMEASDSIGKIYAAEHALFVAEHGTPGIVGREGGFQWLSLFERTITDLLSLCPNVVLNKYIAITGIDGGTLKLTDKEKSEGWRTSEDAKVFTTFFGVEREYRTMGWSLTAPASVLFRGSRTRPMTNVAGGMMSGTYSTRKPPSAKWKCS